MSNSYHCLECGNSISVGVMEFSTEVHGVSLCLKHQIWISESEASAEAVSLYYALKSNKIPVELEFWDGTKTIDIAIPGKLYIQLDGEQHYEAEEALAGLLRDLHAWKDEIPTFKISNSHLRNQYHFEMIVDRLTDICEEFKKTG
jgi:hypothetical protein